MNFRTSDKPPVKTTLKSERKLIQSLRFDLIFDLSLLTLCALILSVGLLISVLRYKVPYDMQDLAQAYLTTLHESFIKSDEFAALPKPFDDELLRTSFEKFLVHRKMGERWSTVVVEISKDASANATHQADKLFSRQHPTLELSQQKILWMIPTIIEFAMAKPLSPAVAGASAPTLKYRWSILPFQQSLTEFKYRVFLLTLAIETILVLLGYFLLFRKNILVPIHNLSVAAREFLQGNWNARIIVERQDELGEVANALNEMAHKIEDKERKLVHTIDSLRKANEELEAAQNEQLQIEKLASIGRLAAGVAHEVGNPLGAISGYVDILRRSIKKYADVVAEDVDLLDHIERETNRISKIIRALLQQARPSQERMKTVALKPVAVRGVQLAQIPGKVDVSFEFEDENAEVYAEQDQLVQVVLNLLINAKHAIESKPLSGDAKADLGRIRIRCVSRKLPVYRSPATGGEPTDYDTSVVRSLKPEVYWVLSVEDNGIGIEDQDQKKLFEPFFSTKAPGKGTGLGLYVTKSIIESFRGAIVVRSAPNYGASFSIFLRKSKPEDWGGS